MNLYGYVGNNPLSFSDPFGLCPDSLRADDGTCPGGLTEREFKRAEYAARNHITPGAQDRVLGLLYDGHLHSGVLDRVANAETASGEITVNTQSRNGNLFESHPALLGYVLAHESEHHEQQTGLQGIMNSIKAFFDKEGTRREMEDAAYSYGCANSKSLLIKHNGSCHP